MKIIALEISGVRVYRTFRRFEFSPGLNVLVGPNRAGKTSLADALAAALYGPDRSGTRSPLAKSDLLTWPGLSDGAGESGTRTNPEAATAVEWGSGGEAFRLERDLNTGRAALYKREGTGWSLRSSASSEIMSLLKEVTGIDRADLFLASAYLRQGDLGRIAEPSCLERIGEILRGLVSGVPQGDVSAMVSGLRSAQRDVKSEGRQGHRPANPREYDRLLDERESVEARLADARASRQSILDLSDRRRLLEEQLPEREGRLDELQGLMKRWKRKEALESDRAAVEAEAETLSRRLRRLRGIRERLSSVAASLDEMGDTDGLKRVVTLELPALRAKRDAADKRSAELGSEVSGLREKLETLQDQMAGLAVFGERADWIDEKLPLWEKAVLEKSFAGRPAGAGALTDDGKGRSAPSWRKIGFAFSLFALVFATPFLDRMMTGRFHLIMFVSLGLAFPLLLWALVLLNRRILRKSRAGRTVREPESPPPGVEPERGGDSSPLEGEGREGGDSSPEEAMARLFQAVGVVSAEEARSGLKKFREFRPGLESTERLLQRAESDLQEIGEKLEGFQHGLAETLRNFGSVDEDALTERHGRTQELLRARDELSAREKELLAEGSEDAAESRLDELDRKRRDLEREHQEGEYGLFNPSTEELEAWRKEEEALKVTVPDQRTEFMQAGAVLEEKLRAGFLSPETLQERLNEIDDRLKDLDRLHRAHGVAAETLEEAARELEDAYLPRLQERVEQQFRRVVGPEYGVDLTTRWPAVTLSLPGNPSVEPPNLSRATADHLFLAMRAACLEWLGGGEPLPLILDDPFVHYDDQARERALAWLQELAEGAQVILIAAREEYASWAEKREMMGKGKLLRVDDAPDEVRKEDGQDR